MSRTDREQRIREVLDLVGLADRSEDLVEKYSGGMKRRLEIARGLMHRPKVLFLDEPTLGLDAQTRRVIWDHILSLNETYRITIILTTHYMEEADYLCERVAIIDHGRILTLDSPANLKDSIGGDVITLRVKDTAGMESIARSLDENARIKVHNGSVSVALANAGVRIPEMLKHAEAAGIEVESVDLHKPTLEDVFIHYTGTTIREQDSGGVDRMRMHLRARMRR
jgi:ABC-2 type transport system ATP-binding protein